MFMFYESAYNLAQNFTKSNRYLTYMHFSEASQGSARRRVNGQIASYFHEIIVLSRQSQPIAKMFMFYESAYNLAQNFTKSNRYLTYMHFSDCLLYTSDAADE